MTEDGQIAEACGWVADQDALDAFFAEAPPPGGVPEEWPRYLGALIVSWSVSAAWLGRELVRAARPREAPQEVT